MRTHDRERELFILTWFFSSKLTLAIQLNSSAFFFLLPLSTDCSHSYPLLPVFFSHSLYTDCFISPNAPSLGIHLSIYASISPRLLHPVTRSVFYFPLSVVFLSPYFQFKSFSRFIHCLLYCLLALSNNFCHSVSLPIFHTRSIRLLLILFLALFLHPHLTVSPFLDVCIHFSSQDYSNSFSLSLFHFLSLTCILFLPPPYLLTSCMVFSGFLSIVRLPSPIHISSVPSLASSLQHNLLNNPFFPPSISIFPLLLAPTLLTSFSSALLIQCLCNHFLLSLFSFSLHHHPICPSVQSRLQ